MKNPITWLAKKTAYAKTLNRHCARVEIEAERLGDHVLFMDDQVARIRALLPGGRVSHRTTETLEAFTDAVEDITTLMEAVIDYRKLLIRADVPDIVSARHDGVEAVFDKYNIPLTQRKEPIGETWAPLNQHVTEADLDRD